jgi:hypothetical protein
MMYVSETITRILFSGETIGRRTLKQTSFEVREIVQSKEQSERSLAVINKQSPVIQMYVSSIVLRLLIIPVQLLDASFSTVLLDSASSLQSAFSRFRPPKSMSLESKL